MPVSVPVPVLRRRIKLDLRRHRENSGESQRAVAAATGIAEGLLNHYEQGRRLPSDDNATKLLRHYEVDEELDEFLATLAQARRRTPSEAAAADPEQFNLYVGLEAGASVIESWDALVLHGLVQTERYAEAMLRGHGPGRPEADVRRGLRLRLRRQNALTGPNPAKLWLIIYQDVLERPVGGPDVMGEQLDHLLALAEQPNITIQVVPRDIVPYGALHGPFIILQFPTENDPGLVYIESRTQGLVQETPTELQEYADVLNELRTLAARPSESMRIIHDIRKEFP